MHVHRLGEASSSNVVRRGGPHTCVVVVNLVRGSIRNGKATCLWVLWTTSQSYLGLLTLNTTHGMHVHRLEEASSSNVVHRAGALTLDSSVERQ